MKKEALQWHYFVLSRPAQPDDVPDALSLRNTLRLAFQQTFGISGELTYLDVLHCSADTAVVKIASTEATRLAAALAAFAPEGERRWTVQREGQVLPALIADSRAWIKSAASD